MKIPLRSSFVGFWIPTSSYPARVSILVVSLLALITQQVQSQPVRSIQTISYNIWANVCIGLVFLALIEFALAIIWEEKHKVRLADQLLTAYRRSPYNYFCFHLNNQEKRPQSTDEDKQKFAEMPGWRGRWARFCRRLQTDGNLVDVYSRVLFPLCFFSFVVFYSLFVRFRQ